ncbi:hypothetical protein L484_016440 [Morus notabilis]|uniref:Uncharacterized protein n=1 Tax=Morus notabilis TaxID=981085 RepID=W9QXQ2_9ROSA|nr:hypothetical protein L484_016440 [Morus notabilis]
MQKFGPFIPETGFAAPFRPHGNFTGKIDTNSKKDKDYPSLIQRALTDLDHPSNSNSTMQATLLDFSTKSIVLAKLSPQLKCYFPSRTPRPSSLVLASRVLDPYLILTV